MPSLKELKNRIKSIKSTQKITKAQKMVAASKLRRAQEQAEAARPYTEAMERLLESLASGISEGALAPPLLVGTGKQETHLIIVATSDRGLCGAFNSSIVRAVRRKVRELRTNGTVVKLICIGRKGYEQLQGEFGSLIIAKSELKNKISYADAEAMAARILALFEAGDFDVAHIVYNKFRSAISQIVTFQQLIPLPPPEVTEDTHPAIAPYDYEPNENEILADLLPRNLGVQIYHALLENAASEQGARMTAMDNATRNAGEMIKKLTIKYNRTRQAAITKELIEIISGAEAV
ncbi:MAG: F0F1 ATP synthase subunit gamma [Rickettsiales bacterium]|nr:F0F1 ATP synthase subunit gamma [Rickettsiales bacterium]